MFTDLDFLRHARPIINARECGSATQFVKELNHWIHGYGDWGYEEAERCSLKVSTKYTVDEAKELLYQIEITDNTPKTDITVINVNEAPYGLVMKLVKEAGGNTGKPRRGEYKYAALRGYEAIGFLSGATWRESISIGGLYVVKEYRRKGISNRMFDLLYEDAKADGLNSLSMSTPSWNGQDALRGFSQHLEVAGVNVKIDIGYGEMEKWANLEWK